MEMTTKQAKRIIGALARVSAKRASLPCLSSICIDGGHLRATDLETELTVSPFGGTGDLAVSVEAAALLAVIKAPEYDDLVTLRPHGEQSLFVDSLKLPAVSACEYPAPMSLGDDPVLLGRI